MGNKQLIARADDLGSSMSANRAIERVIGAGVIRNVSVMACGPFVEAAAEMLAGRKDVCFGMHTTLNAEWDQVKWEPVAGAGRENLSKGQGALFAGQGREGSFAGMGQANPLVDENGYFLSDPSLFLQTKPSVEQVMREVDAQLERLYKLGFDIRYIDSHMFSEAYVEGMDEAMAEFAVKKGLVDHMYFYHLLPDMGRLSELAAGLEDFENMPAGACKNRLVDFAKNLVTEWEKIPAGQYFIVVHPSLDTEEMRRTGNAGVSGADVAKSRARETEIFSAPELRTALETAGFACVRYDEAAGEKRMTVPELLAEMAKASGNKG